MVAIYNFHRGLSGALALADHLRKNANQQLTLMTGVARPSGWRGKKPAKAGFFVSGDRKRLRRRSNPRRRAPAPNSPAELPDERQHRHRSKRRRTAPTLAPAEAVIAHVERLRQTVIFDWKPHTKR